MSCHTDSNLLPSLCIGYGEPPFSQWSVAGLSSGASIRFGVLISQITHSQSFMNILMPVVLETCLEYPGFLPLAACKANPPAKESRFYNYNPNWKTWTRDTSPPVFSAHLHNPSCCAIYFGLTAVNMRLMTKWELSNTLALAQPNLPFHIERQYASQLTPLKAPNSMHALHHDRYFQRSLACLTCIRV